MRPMFLAIVYTAPMEWERDPCSAHSTFVVLVNSQTETGFKMNFLEMNGENSITAYCIVLTFKLAKTWWLVKEVSVFWSSERRRRKRKEDNQKQSTKPHKHIPAFQREWTREPSVWPDSHTSAVQGAARGLSRAAPASASVPACQTQRTSGWRSCQRHQSWDCTLPAGSPEKPWPSPGVWRAPASAGWTCPQHPFISTNDRNRFDNSMCKFSQGGLLHIRQHASWLWVHAKTSAHTHIHPYPHSFSLWCC